MAETVKQGQSKSDFLPEKQNILYDDGMKRKAENSRARKKKRSRKDLDGVEKRGVCYLSRVAPHMDPSHIRQILSQYGDIQRIYLVPEGNSVIPHGCLLCSLYNVPNLESDSFFSYVVWYIGMLFFP